MSEVEVPPEEFVKVMRDFIGDIKTTFPEYCPLIAKWWKDKEFFSYIEDEEERKVAFEKAEKASIQFVFSFCKKKIPERIFDILYQNEDMFKPDSNIDTEFLPHILFKNLWQFDISEKTRETIWKYLQLIMFSLIGTIHNTDAFGDSAKLFEAINEDEFKSKLEDILSQMKGIFDLPEGMKGEENAMPNVNMEDMPKAEDIHAHISGMLDGKLGKLAKEIAEETADSLNMDMENTTDMKDMFSNLMKNPTKLMGLVKTVSSKLDSKIKSGDLKESELISEATDLMNKMKNIPGMENIQSMLNKMGFSGKVNTNAMQSQLNKNMKQALNKERMLSKLEAKRLAKEKEQSANIPQSSMSVNDEEIVKIFSTGEKVEKTLRGVAPPASTSSDKKKNKKKVKK
jgi:hypothetical protein